MQRAAEKSLRSVGTAELKKFKEVWQKYDIYSTGSIGLKHLIPFVEGVGDPVGRSKCSLMWSQVLRAEIAAIPGAQTSGEISFRNLFLILTTKMQGADAICEDVDGGIKTNIDQVITLSLHCSRCRELYLVCIYYAGAIPRSCPSYVFADHVFADRGTNQYFAIVGARVQTE